MVTPDEGLLVRLDLTAELVMEVQDIFPKQVAGRLLNELQGGEWRFCAGANSGYRQSKAR